MVQHIIRADILLIARIFPHPCGARKNTTQLAKYPHLLFHYYVILPYRNADGIRMFSENSYQKIEANSNMTVFFCSGIINILFKLIARIFPRPCEARKNTRNSQNIRTYQMLNHRIRCIYCKVFFLHYHYHYIIITYYFSACKRKISFTKQYLMLLTQLPVIKKQSFMTIMIPM